MRIEELGLAHYGAFASRVLDLRAAPGLAIVYGANEAGKSTCLNAVLDLLFGVPHASRHGGQFGYDKMLLDGSLRRSSGELLRLRRRKGRAGRTLSTDEGAPLEERVLADLLGVFDRERYAALFALDHSLLRSGGEALLGSNGEIGRLIVEAGGGLSQLMPLLDVLEAQAESLYAPRAARDRAFYKGLAGLDAARKGIRENTLTREQFDDAEGRVRDLHTQIDALRASQRGLRARIAEAERLLRVSPLLIEYAELERELAEEGDGPPCARDFPARVRNALLAEDQADEAVRRAELELVRARESVQGVSVDEALLAEEPALAVLEERRARLAVLKEGEPGLRQELHAVLALLARSDDLLAAEASEAEREARHKALDQLEPSAARIVALAERERVLRLRIAEDDADEQSARAIEARAAAAGAHEPWPLDLQPLAELAHEAAQLARSEARIAELGARHEAGVAALGFPAYEPLRDLFLPDPGVVRSAVDAERRSAERVAQLEASASELTRRRAQVEERLRQLVNDFALPAPERLGELRAERDAVWQTLRAEYLTLQPPLNPLLARGEREERAKQFTRILGEADAVADVLASAAQSVAEVRVLERELEHTERELAFLVDALSGERGARDARRVELVRGFADAARHAPDAVSLLALIERRAELTREADELTRLREQRAQEAARVSAHGDLLARAEGLLGLTGAHVAPGTRVNQVLSRVRTREALHGEYVTARDGRLARGAERARRRAEAELVREEKAQAESTFAAALAALGLPSDTPPERAAQLVQSAREHTRAVSDRRRIEAELAQITSAERELAEALHALARFLPAGFAVDAANALAVLLRTRFARALAAVERRSALAEQCTSTERELTRTRDGLTRARAERALLANEGGVEPTLLHVAARRTERLHTLRDKRDALRLRTAQAGDGHAVEALRERLAERDAAALRAEIASDHDELNVCAGKLESSVLALAQAEAALARFTAAGSLNELHAQREAAVTELTGTVEQYLTLRLARELLQRAVADVRTEQRDPLVSRASVLFARATEGAFRGLDTEVSRHDEPVVFGVRADGSAVALAEMSDGTRDQLFLAFRLASVEHYCSVREPLPFIGDDLLVHFDDARSRATLELLAEFGATTQVLLFTHHQSVCELARDLVRAGKAGIVTLGERTQSETSVAAK